MSTKLVYTVGKTGDIEGLLKDEKLDTSKFGHRKIDRITLIDFDAAVQRFYIKWLLGPYKDQIHSLSIEAAIFGDRMHPSNDGSAHVTFPSYAAAVSHEIECVNRLREQGYSLI